MSLSAAAGGFVVFLLTLPVVQGQNGWGVTYNSTKICATKGSTVDINCTYRYPPVVKTVDKTFWLTRIKPEFLDLQEDSEYAGRVQYDCGSNECTLTVTDLRLSDSAEYYFRFITNQNALRYYGSPGVTLTVTALQVQVTRITVNQSHSEAELKCLSSCSSDDDISYVWFKNGEKIMEEETSVYSGQFNPGDNVSCALNGHEDFPSSPTVYAPIVPSVLVTPPGDIMQGSSVNLTCSGNANISANYTWYKKNVNPDLQPLSKEPQLAFSSIQSSDSGEYYCTAENQLGKSTSKYIFIDVKYAPKLSSVSVNPSGEIVEGSSVTLNCSSDANPAAKYTWYKDNQTLFHGSEGVYNFTSISSEERAMYYCISENQYGQINSLSLFIDVLYGPKIPSVSVSPSGEITEGSSVILTCSSDANPAANYTWYKKNVNPDLQPLSKEPQLVFSSIQSSDSGEYYCTAESRMGKRTSEYIPINVKYGPKLPSVSVSPSGNIIEGSSVTLTCSSDANPAANYTWYKKNVNPDLHPLSKEPQLVFSSIQSSDSGEYYCTADNQLEKRTSEYIIIGVKYAPKLPSVSASPSAEIVEGSSVTLTCSSDANPAAKYTWYKENEDSPKASGQIFTITDVRPEHGGNYYCVAQNRRGSHNSTLHLTVVKDAPKLPSVTVSPSAEITDNFIGKSVFIMIIIWLILLVLLLFLLLLLILWMRKKKTLSSTTDLNEPE